MNKYWAIDPKVLREYRKFKSEHAAIDQVAIVAFDKIRKAHNEDLDLTIVDGIAILPIRGSLGNRKSFFSFMFDGELDTYPSIIHMIQSADANPAVTEIRLLVDSPGGQLDGLFDLLDVIKATTTPIESIVESRADSAAYGIVSQTDKITASGEISEIGSIGIGASFFVDEEIIDITSTEAPNKWPDVTTPEGVAIEKAELDTFHEKFAKIIAEGRSAATGRVVTIDTVNNNFGRGGTMLAEAGRDAGMIDEIMPSPERVSNATFFENSGPSSSGFRSEKNKTIGCSMNKKELESQHPELFTSMLEEGRKAERDRVSALLETGKTCGQIEYAIKCVQEGSRITDDKVQGKFLGFRFNKKDQDKREADDIPPLNPPVHNADKIDEDALAESFAKKQAKKYGVKSD